MWIPGRTLAGSVFLVVLMTSIVHAAYSDAVLLDNPVAYYRLSETSGTVAANSGSGGSVLDGSTSTYANPQVSPSTPPQIGQPGPRPGDVSGVYEIQGFAADNVGIRSTANTGAQLSVPDNALLDITGSSGGLTLEAWVNRNATQASTGNTEGILGKFLGTGNQRSYVLTYINATNRLQFVVNSGGAAANNVSLGGTGDVIPLAANEWTHLAAVYDPSDDEFFGVASMKLYVNGVIAGTLADGSVPAALFVGTADLWVGRQFSTASNVTFEGLIDEAAVYDQPLSAARIAAHYSAAAGTTPTFYAWDQNSSGDWNVAANWALDTIPNTNTRVALFGGAITSPRVVYTNAAVSLKGLRFDSSNQYAIAGTGTITLSAASGNSSVRVLQGAHEVQAAVVLGTNTDINVTAGSVDFNNVLDIGTRTLSLQAGRTNINHSLVASGTGNIMNAATLGTAGSTPFGGNLTSTGTLDIDIGGTATDYFDAFQVSGTATLSGILDVELINGFTLGGTEMFTVLTAGTLVNNGITLSGPAADMFDLMVMSNTLVLKASVGLDGDFNFDNRVDAADYVVWRKTDGTPAGYGLWRANFGAGMGSGSVNQAAVPEPSAIVLSGLACAVLIGFRRRRPGQIALLAAVAVGIVGNSKQEALAGPYSDAVVASQPVAYYRLEEADFSFIAANSGTSGFALDGFYNQFTEAAGPRSLAELGPRPGDIAGGYVIDGLEAGNLAPYFGPAPADFTRVQVEDHVDLDITGAITLEAWVNRDASTSTSNRGIISKYANFTGQTNQRAYNLYYSPVSGHVGLGLSNDGLNKPDFTLTTGAQDLPIGEWTHVAATYDPTTLAMAIYFNGQQVATRTVDAQYSSIFNSTAPLWIGHQFNTSAAATFEGRIDEAAVYNKVLTAGEILGHFTAATGAFVSNYAWNVNASGNWGALNNWNPGSVPNSNGVTVTFGNAITSPQTVVVESSITAKVIEFNNANKYAIAGTGEIVLSANVGAASIAVTQGNHEFQAPVRLESDTNVNVAAGSLTFNNVLDLNGHDLDIQSGTVHIRNIVIPGAGGMLTSAGTLAAANASSIAGDFASTGVLEFGIESKDTHGSLSVGGTATLSGLVSPIFADGFVPSAGDTFTLLTAANLVDQGISLAGPSAEMLRLSVGASSLVLTAIPEPHCVCLLATLIAGMAVMPPRRRS